MGHRSLKRRGADFIKVYDGVPRDAYFAIAEESRRRRIPFVGHVPTAVTTILAALALSIVPLTGQTGGEPNKSKRIDALTSAPSLVVYAEDGAADATVTVNPPPEVRAIVDLGSRSIPLLIAHLDDARPTSAKFNGNPVPVGYVCLDILTNIVRAPGVLLKDCADDGLGACVDGRYYFRPDAFARKGGGFAAGRDVTRVKANWQRAYRRGGVRFKHPAWWKRRT